MSSQICLASSLSSVKNYSEPKIHLTFQILDGISTHLSLEEVAKFVEVNDLEGLVQQKPYVNIEDSVNYIKTKSNFNVHTLFKLYQLSEKVCCPVHINGFIEEFESRVLDILCKIELAEAQDFPTKELKKEVIESMVNEMIQISNVLKNKLYRSSKDILNISNKIDYFLKTTWGRFKFQLNDCYSLNRSTIAATVSANATVAAIASIAGLIISPSNSSTWWSALAGSFIVGTAPLAYLGLKAYYSRHI